MKQFFTGIIFCLLLVGLWEFITVPVVAKEPARTSIPKAFGELIAVNPHLKNGESQLWFRAPNGDIRIVIVE